MNNISINITDDTLFVGHVRQHPVDGAPTTAALLQVLHTAPEIGRIRGICRSYDGERQLDNVVRGLAGYRWESDLPDALEHAPWTFRLSPGMIDELVEAGADVCPDTEKEESHAALRNLTPHEIHLLIDLPTGEVEIITLPSAGLARVEETVTPVSSVVVATTSQGTLRTPIATVMRSNVSGLPASAPGVLYIVSTMVREALPSRLDLLSPGAVARDEGGRIIGCRSLYQNS